MIYFFFHTARGVTPLLAIGASLTTLMMLVLFLLTAGASIRTSADGGKPSRTATLFRFLMIMFCTLAIASIASALLGETAIERAPRDQEPINAILQFVVGPDTIDTRRALQFALIMGMATFVTNVLLISQTAQGSPLRLWMDRFRGINRKQDIHGSSHFATLQEYKRFRKNQHGGVNFYGRFYGDQQGPQKYTYLGDMFSLNDEDAARGIITIGNPGSGKSSSVILPIIFDSMRLGQNLVITDPQLELRNKIIKYAGVFGHRVIIHDPTATQLPRFNLARGIKTVSQAQAVADVLIPKGGGGSDGFWTKSAQNLLAACLLRYDNVGSIYTDFSNAKAMAKKLGEFNDDAQRLAGSFINSISDSDGKFATNVIATLSTSLSGWADQAIRDSTEDSDFDVRDLVNADVPTVLVLACPGAERRVIAPYLGAVLTKMLFDLDSIGERQADGQLPIPVKFVLEEFPALGDLSSVVEFANLVRKRRISFILACQTMGQLENIYGRNGSQTLLAGMAFQIIFGGCDQATAKYFSDVAGAGTTRKANEDGRIQERQRKLLTPDEIIRPPQGNSTIFGRYVTAEYATYVIVLSRLTRIYERKDVAVAMGKVHKKQAKSRIMRRGRDEKQKNDEMPNPEVVEMKPDTPQDIGTSSDEKTPALIPVIDKPIRPVVVKPIGVIN
jgi:type IV secretory pathway TraG/TraD family ATPase VirD4